MGIAKRMQEEEHRRGYRSNNGRTVCSNCFEENGIEQYIVKNSSHNSCSYCEENGDHVKACTLDSLIEHILESLHYEWGNPTNEGLPYDSREGGWQVAKVRDTWDLLEYISLGDKLGQIHEDISESIHSKEWCRKDPYSLSTDETLLLGWERFTDFVKNKARYVFFKAENSNYDSSQHDVINPIDILGELEIIIKTLNLISKINNTTTIERVRIVNPQDMFSTAKELGTPPAQLATIANRMSPAGIPMFYGAFDIETAIKETYEETEIIKKAICGIFTPLRELVIVDLSERQSLPSIFDQNQRKKRNIIKFLNDFIDDFSKPIMRKDRAHIDYVPTQIVTEYIRHIFKTENGNRIDGILYRSSKNSEKKAIVIFADSEQCIEQNEKANTNSLLRLTAIKSKMLP